MLGKKGLTMHGFEMKLPQRNLLCNAECHALANIYNTPLVQKQLSLILFESKDIFLDWELAHNTNVHILLLHTQKNLKDWSKVTSLASSH